MLILVNTRLTPTPGAVGRAVSRRDLWMLPLIATGPESNRLAQTPDLWGLRFPGGNV